MLDASSKKLLKAPFSYFGGKSLIASTVWEALGNVKNYIEPFFGSGAVLLARPGGWTSGLETVNDLDGLIANFWRAVKYDPVQTAHYADWPVNENDLHARHKWLLEQLPELPKKLEADPEYYDSKIAGWWVWGLNCWIGSGFCSGKLSRQKPHLGNLGRGVHRRSMSSVVPGNVSTIYDWFEALSIRLRLVRVCCGDWKRVVSPVALTAAEPTGVFLDPPYSVANVLYANEDKSVLGEVRQWCKEHSDLRIVLCGLEGEHNELEELGWRKISWKSNGGYALQGKNKDGNRTKERLWLSPSCVEQKLLV